MNRLEFNEYLTKSLDEINQDYTQDAIDIMLDNSEKKKNTQKKLLALAVTVVAVRGIAKYMSTNDIKLSKALKLNFN